MYIILKGSVNVQIYDKQYDIDKTVAQKRDGECFGELALVDVN